MILPHNAKTSQTFDPEAQVRYEANLDRCISRHDFDVNPEVFVPDPANLSLVDRQVVLAKYQADSVNPTTGEVTPGWLVRLDRSGVYLKMPHTAPNPLS